jgi:hypothetical protein
MVRPKSHLTISESHKLMATPTASAVEWIKIMHLQCMIYFVAQEIQFNGSGVLLQQTECIIIAHKTQIENSQAWWVANNSTKITNLRPASWWNWYLSTIKISHFSVCKEGRTGVEQEHRMNSPTTGTDLHSKSWMNWLLRLAAERNKLSCNERTGWL